MSRPAYSGYTDQILRMYCRAMERGGVVVREDLTPVARLNYDACVMVFDQTPRWVREAAQQIYTDRSNETFGLALRAYLEAHPDERAALPYELRTLAKRLAKARWLVD